jgi:hypothetical protein
LQLYYEDRIGADLYAEQDHLLRQQIAKATAEARAREAEVPQPEDVAAQFEAVAGVLADLDVEAVWLEASQEERRVLVQELVEEANCSRTTLRRSWPALRASTHARRDRRAEPWCPRGDTLHTHTLQDFWITSGLTRARVLSQLLPGDDHGRGSAGSSDVEDGTSAPGGYSSRP